MPLPWEDFQTKPKEDPKPWEQFSTKVEEAANAPTGGTTLSNGKTLGAAQPAPPKPVEHWGNDAGLGLPAPYYDQKKADDAGFGVHTDIPSPLTMGTRATGGLASSPQVRLEYYKQHLPPGTPTQISPKSGALLYYNADKQAWANLENYGPGSEDIAPTVGNVAEMGGAIGGGVAGAALGVGTTGGLASAATAAAGSTLGAAGGRGLYELGRGELAKAAGVDPKAHAAIAQEAAKDGLVAGLWNAAGEMTFGASRLVRNFLGGLKVPLTRKTAEFLIGSAQKYDPLVTKINNAPGMDARRLARAKDLGVVDPENYKFRIRADQTTDSPEVTGLASAAAEHAPIAKQMRGDEWQQWDVLDMYLDNANSPFHSPYIMGQPSAATRAGNLPLEGVRAEQRATVGAANQKAATSQTALEQSSKQTPGGADNGTLGANIRQGVEDLREPRQKEVSDAYADFSQKMGATDGLSTPKHQIPVTPEIQAWNDKLGRLAGARVTESQKAPYNNLRIQTQVDPVTGIDSGEIDLGYLQDAIKRNRDAARTDWNNQATLGITAAEREQMTKQLVKLRDDYVAKYPEMQESLIKAENLSKDYHDDFSTRFVDNMLASDGRNGYKLQDPQVFTQMFTDANRPAVAQVAELAKASPQLQSELRQAAFSYYRDKVMVNGVIDPAKHAAFLKDRNGYDTIRELFSKEDQALIKTQGGLAKAVINSQEKAEAAQKAWDLALGGRLQRTDAYSPEGMIKLIMQKGMSPMAPSEIKGLMKIVAKNTDGGLEAWRAGVANEVKRTITQSGRIDSQALAKMIEEKGDHISALMGPQYLKDLQTVAEASKVISKKAEANNMLQYYAGSPVITKGFRTTLGPLSKENRFITFGKDLREQNTAGKLYRALNDPKALAKWATYYKRLTAQYTAAGAVGTGVSLLREDENDVD